MSRAISWKNVEVVRPQPGQAVTWGRNERRPIDWSTCCATCTSSVRSPPGSGVRLTRMVSPMPALEQDRQPGGRGDDALGAHAGLGQAEVERVVAALGQAGVDLDEVLHAGDLRREDDPVVAEPRLLGQARRAQGGLDHGLDHHLAAVAPARASAALASIISVSSCWSSEPQLTPMRTGFSFAIATSMICANCSSRRFVPTLPGLMRYLASAAAACGVLREQQVAVVVEVADERHADAQRVELGADDRHRLARPRRC